MSMQVSCIPQPQVVLPPSDVKLMESGLAVVSKSLQDISEGIATESTYEELTAAVKEINEIIFSVDNSNDFYKIGGFNLLMPLLSCANSEVVAATAELIADLCQNNAYCQAKILDFSILSELVNLLERADSKVCFKALYAISCLCRHNEDAVERLTITSFVPSILKILLDQDERLRAKAAFFLSYLCTYENFRESFYQADVVKVLVKLLKDKEDSSSEHLLSAMLSQVSLHKQSRTQCRNPDYGLKSLLLQKLELYESKDKYQEAKEYCNKILDACFHEEIKQK